MIIIYLLFCHLFQHGHRWTISYHPVCPLVGHLIIIALMRILGVGVDLVMNARIEQILTKNYA